MSTAGWVPIYSHFSLTPFFFWQACSYRSYQRIICFGKDASEKQNREVTSWGDAPSLNCCTLSLLVLYLPEPSTKRRLPKQHMHRLQIRDTDVQLWKLNLMLGFRGWGFWACNSKGKKNQCQFLPSRKINSKDLYSRLLSVKLLMSSVTEVT